MPEHQVHSGSPQILNERMILSSRILSQGVAWSFTLGGRDRMSRGASPEAGRCDTMV